MLFTFLLVVQSIVALALVSVILMQRSEGGGLGVGGSSSGLMTARGAADFLTRSTAILATVFIVLSITLAAIAGTHGDTQAIDTSLVGETAPANPQGAAPAAEPAPTQPADEGGVPLAQ